MERMLKASAPYFLAEGVEESVRGLLDGSTFTDDSRAAGNFVRTAVVALWALGLGSAHIIREVHIIFIFSPIWRGRLKRLLRARLAARRVAALVALLPGMKENERGYLRFCLVIINRVQNEMFKVRDEKLARPRDACWRTALIDGNCSVVKRSELAIGAVALSGVRLMHLGEEKFARGAEFR
jgi:hypothetical protein